MRVRGERERESGIRQSPRYPDWLLAILNRESANVATKREEMEQEELFSFPCPCLLSSGPEFKFPLSPPPPPLSSLRACFPARSSAQEGGKDSAFSVCPRVCLLLLASICGRCYAGKWVLSLLSSFPDFLFYPFDGLRVADSTWAHHTTKEAQMTNLTPHLPHQGKTL